MNLDNNVKSPQEMKDFLELHGYTFKETLKGYNEIGFEVGRDGEICRVQLYPNGWTIGYSDRKLKKADVIKSKIQENISSKVKSTKKKRERNSSQSSINQVANQIKRKLGYDFAPNAEWRGAGCIFSLDGIDGTIEFNISEDGQLKKSIGAYDNEDIKTALRISEMFEWMWQVARI